MGNISTFQTAQRRDTVPVTYRGLTRADVALLPPPEWLIEGLLETNSIAMLYGQPGIGKTFVTLDLALTLASGISWWGQYVKPVPVLYVLSEGAGRLNDRLTAWERTRQTAIDNIWFITSLVDLTRKETPDALLAAMPVMPGLVIIDTLARCVGNADQDSNTDMSGVVNALTKMQQDSGATILMVHHPGKTDNGPRGASCLIGAVETQLKLTYDGSLLKLQAEKQRNADIDMPWLFSRDVITIGTRLDTGKPLTTCVINLNSLDYHTINERNLTPNQRMILEWLDSRVLDPATPQEIVDATTLSKSVVYRELDQLEKAGMIDLVSEKRPKQYMLTEKGKNALTSRSHSTETDSQGFSQFPNHIDLGMGKLKIPVFPGNDGNSQGTTMAKPVHPCLDCGAVSWKITAMGQWVCNTCGNAAEMEV